MIAGAKLNQLDFSVTSISKRDRPHLLVGLLHAKPWQVAMIGLGTAATQLDTSVNIAFPAITRGFDLSIGDIQWVVICYVLTYASLLLAMGRIGDTVGHAVVFRIGLIWSTVALLLVGWSPSFGAMLLFRCLQGIGAALVLSCGAALVTSLYGEERRSQALGIYTMMLSVGLMLGPLLGGALTAAWDWPAVFWFRIPIAVVALLLFRDAPASPQRQVADRFDVLGGVALMLGLVTMLLALNRLREFSGILFGLLSALAFAVFIFRESRAARPIIAVELLRQRGFGLLNLVSVLANLAAFSVWLLVPYFLARVPGYSLTESGVILATAAAGARHLPSRILRRETVDCWKQRILREREAASQIRQRLEVERLDDAERVRLEAELQHRIARTRTASRLATLELVSRLVVASINLRRPQNSGQGAGWIAGSLNSAQCRTRVGAPM